MYMQSSLMKALFSGDIQAYLKPSEAIRRQDLGMLLLPTGRVAANDPCCFFEKEPFTRTVAPGEYPVRLFILETSDDKRVAFAAVCFSEHVPQQFEPALTGGQDPSGLAGDEFFGYGVDSGTGAFMDASACDVYEALLGQSEDSIYPPLDKALDESYVYTYSVANVPLPESGCNIVAFSSGWGDGSYPSYWGLDGQGEICCLVTDFLIIGD